MAYRSQAERYRQAAQGQDQEKNPEGRARQASVPAKVGHPFRVTKRQLGLVKVQFRGLAKNTAHVVTLVALSNLMARAFLISSRQVLDGAKAVDGRCGEQRVRKQREARR